MLTPIVVQRCVLQCVAVCCSKCCSVLQCVAVWFGVVRYVQYLAPHFDANRGAKVCVAASVAASVAVCFSVLQCGSVWCGVCNILPLILNTIAVQR